MNYDPDKPLWSIMTKSRGGTVSVIRDLTLAQARQMYERLDPAYGRHVRPLMVHKDFLPKKVTWSAIGGQGYDISDGDIEIREVFGPEGWESKDFLTKVTFVYTDADGKILPDEYGSTRKRDEG